MTISIALGSYNGSPFLAEQLASIAAQERQPDEVVICDDLSQDDSVASIRAFADRMPYPVRVYCNETNLGSTQNFCQAIRRCNGHLIALADQDDIWHKTKLACIETTFLESPHIGMVLSDAEVVGNDLQPLGYRLWESIGFTTADQQRFEKGRGFDVLLTKNVVTGATLAFRSLYRDLVLPIPRLWVHNAWIGLLISAVAQVACIREPLVKYRQHLNQVGVRRHTYVRRIIAATRERRDVFLSALERFECVEARFTESDCALADSQAHLKLLGKLHHLRKRGHMSQQTWSKLAIIFQELRSGRYHQYSFGFHSALADLIRQK